MTTMPAADACSTVPADAPAPSAETTDVSDAGPRLLAMMTERPARRAVRAIACPSRPAPMMPTRLRSAGSIRFPPQGAGTVGLSRPDATLILEWTIGSPNDLAVFTVDTMLLSGSSGSMDRTVANCAGWSSIRTRAAFCGVIRWSATGPRIEALVIRITSPRSGMDIEAVAEVQADRLHHLERRALGEHVARREHADVFLDHRRRSGPGDLVQGALERGPDVLAVLLEVRRGIKGGKRGPDAGG